MTAAEIIARLESAQIANARQNTVEEFIEHPQLKAAEAMEHSGFDRAGLLPGLLPPGEMENVEPVMNEVPSLGQHTDAILSEIGFDADTIARMAPRKII